MFHSFTLELLSIAMEWLKNFDVFPKTVDDAKEVSVSGGSVRLVCVPMIAHSTLVAVISL